MGKDDPRWLDGRAAWERLRSWWRPHPAGDGMAALADVGQLRRLLDQIEFAAVRQARRDGRSWAEIAVSLGVTRQSAWERFRDFDRSPEMDPPDPSAAPTAAVSADLVALQARRRRASIVVPDVVGLDLQSARLLISRAGLHAVAADPDGPPLELADERRTIIKGQAPESGAKVPADTRIRLWLDERGDGSGGAGVREPRRPTPRTGSGRAVADS
jgi:hypothetical protein